MQFSIMQLGMATECKDAQLEVIVRNVRACPVRSTAFSFIALAEYYARTRTHAQLRVRTRMHAPAHVGVFCPCRWA